MIWIENAFKLSTIKTSYHKILVNAFKIILYFLRFYVIVNYFWFPPKYYSHGEILNKSAEGSNICSKKLIVHI